MLVEQHFGQKTKFILQSLDCPVKVLVMGFDSFAIRFTLCHTARWIVSLVGMYSVINGKGLFVP